MARTRSKKAKEEKSVKERAEREDACVTGSEQEAATHSDPMTSKSETRKPDPDQTGLSHERTTINSLPYEIKLILLELSLSSPGTLVALSAISRDFRTVYKAHEGKFVNVILDESGLLEEDGTPGPYWDAARLLGNGPHVDFLDRSKTYSRSVGVKKIQEILEDLRSTSDIVKNAVGAHARVLNLIEPARKSYGKTAETSEMEGWIEGGYSFGLWAVWLKKMHPSTDYRMARAAVLAEDGDRSQAEFDAWSWRARHCQASVDMAIRRMFDQVKEKKLVQDRVLFSISLLSKEYWLNFSNFAGRSSTPA